LEAGRKPGKPEYQPMMSTRTPHMNAFPEKLVSSGRHYLRYCSTPAVNPAEKAEKMLPYWLSVFL